MWSLYSEGVWHETSLITITIPSPASNTAFGATTVGCQLGNEQRYDERSNATAFGEKDLRNTRGVKRCVKLRYHADARCG